MATSRIVPGGATVSIVDRFPRVHLAHLPTPLEPLQRLTSYLGGPKIWIKRDDQTGLATGGNKARKLEFLVADAVSQGADTLITTGGPQSNHSRQTAAAAARAGLRAVLALTGQSPREWNGNLLLDDLLGAEVRWLGEATWWELPKRLNAIAEGERQAGYQPYVVPLGGSTTVGALGYILAMEELAEQATAAGVRFDRIVMASSSAGTQAGMLMGAEAVGWKGQVSGISVAETTPELKGRVTRLMNETLTMLGKPFTVSPSRLQVIDRYIGEGYAVVGDPERESIRLLASLEGILLGPVYTGRAMAGMIDMIRSGDIRPDETVLFWHTGDTSALFAYADVLRR
jgi:L-cysteate sulfo-lyase